MLNNAAGLIGFKEELKIENGIGIVDFTTDRCHENSHSTVHGGILYAICEEAVGQYVYSIGREGVGMDGSIKYYRPVNPGDKITVKITERKAGKRVGVFLAEIYGNENKLICDGLFTIMFA